MTRFKRNPKLHGWDDEKVYFIDETGVEWCVSDYPELVARLVEICRDYFAQKADVQSRDERTREQRGTSWPTSRNSTCP